MLLLLSCVNGGWEAGKDLGFSEKGIFRVWNNKHVKAVVYWVSRELVPRPRPWDPPLELSNRVKCGREDCSSDLDHSTVNKGMEEADPGP